MVKKLLRVAFRSIAIITVILFILFSLPMLVANIFSENRIFTSADSPPSPVAIVFGAGLNRDGSPGAVLRDRISTAAELYFSGKVQKLLMSGDNRFVDYNEPGAMQSFAIELGIPTEDIVLDYAGRRTYDTCYRALQIFGVNEAILVTQDYHLPRALITCNVLGLKSTGVAADRREYHPVSFTRWWIREVPATLVAFWDVFISRPLPVLGDPEPIFSATTIIQP